MKSGRITRTDKSGVPFEIGICSFEDLPSVLEMYRNFHPKAASQGLPPEDPEICQNWIKQLFEIGQNVFALRNDVVIGHAALIPDPRGKSGEFIVFVNQNHRNLGIGTGLTQFALEKCRQLGFDSIWLTVGVLNSIAIKLYRKFGFEYSDMDKYERVMRIKVELSKSIED